MQKTLLNIFKIEIFNDTRLRNIANGMSADETVNAHDAYSIWEGLLKNMDGQTTSECIIKKKQQKINFASKNKFNINENDSISVDPKLLFQ